MKNEVLGIGRGYLMGFLVVGGFIGIMIALISTGARMGDVKQWAEIYTTFAIPILGVVLIPKELGKIGQAFATKKNGEK